MKCRMSCSIHQIII